MSKRLFTHHLRRSLSSVSIGIRECLVIVAVAFALVMTSAQSSQAVEISENGDTIIVMDATYDEYIALTLSMMPEYRVSSFSVRGALFSLPFYSCILERNVDDIDVYHQMNLTAEQLQTTVNNLDGDAEMMQIQAYRFHNGSAYVERYAYLAYDREGPDWTVYIDVPDEWVDDFEAMLPSDQNIVDRCFTYVWPSNMTALYKADNTETIDMGVSLTESEFAIMRNHLAGEGFRVTSMGISYHSISSFDWSIRFRPIFKRDGNLRYTTEALAKSDADGIADLHEGQVSHMRPMWIVASGIEDFIVGFRGDPVWNDLLEPTIWNGYFDPHLAASPKPHDKASNSNSNGASTKKAK